MSSETRYADDDAAADLRHEFEIEGFDRVESRVIVRIAHERRVGEQQCGKAGVPERRMVAETRLGHEKSVPHDGQGLNGKAIDFFECGGETFEQRGGAPISHDAEKIGTVGIEPAEAGRISLASGTAVRVAQHLERQHPGDVRAFRFKSFGQMTAADHIELFEIESAEEHFVAKLCPGENSRGLRSTATPLALSSAPGDPST